jgi:hypothetical protein
MMHDIDKQIKEEKMVDLTVIEGGLEEYELQLILDILSGISKEDFEKRLKVLRPLIKEPSRGSHLKLVVNNDT